MNAHDGPVIQRVHVRPDTSPEGGHMELYEAIEKRKTIRRFGGAATAEQLHRILLAGVNAPSAKNMQPWEFILVQNPETLSQLAELKAQLTAAKPSASAEDRIKIAKDVQIQKESFENVSVLAVCNDARCKRSTWLCVENMLLASVAENLGAGITLYWGEPRAKACRLLNIPDAFELTCLVKIGIPAEAGFSRDENPWNRRRKPFSWLHHEAFGNRQVTES